MKMFFITLFCLQFINSNGQACTHKNLSKTLDFKIEIKRVKSDSFQISLLIATKAGKQTQIIKFNSDFIFEKDFKNCSAVRSYITGVNKNFADIDNDFGDFIVADYNFDGKEDFAIKKDSGGNGGPLYNYYIQNKNSKFILDEFLSNTVEFFPYAINNAKKTLTTLVHANIYEMGKTIYKYEAKDKKWKVVSKTLLKSTKD